MIPVARPKTTSGAPTPKSDAPKAGGLFQTVVFSRKNTSHGPDDFGNTAGGGKTPPKKPLADLNHSSSALASIVHQTDRSGKQHQSSLAPRPLGRGTASSSSARRLARDGSGSAGGQ